MITTHTNSVGTIWKIATSPTKEEIVEIMKEMNITDDYLEELQTPTPQSVCMNIHGTTYAVFHIPIHKKVKNENPLQYSEAEIDILIKDKMIVTICYSPIEDFDIDVEYALKHNSHSTPTDLWWHLLTHIYKDKHLDADDLVFRVKELREKIFTDKEHIEIISDIHRAYLAIDFPIATHGDIVDSIYEEEEKRPNHKENSVRVWSKLQGEMHRLTQKLDKLGAYIHELRDTQMTLIEARQNSLIQTFTILTFIFLPINFLAALFGMNVINMPIVGHPLGFWILSGAFAALSLMLLLFFKVRRWL
ncbi:MAG: CorA family divalent cation transporter [Patescibacteria group bacterium]